MLNGLCVPHRQLRAASHENTIASIIFFLLVVDKFVVATLWGTLRSWALRSQHQESSQFESRPAASSEHLCPPTWIGR